MDFEQKIRDELSRIDKKFVQLKEEIKKIRKESSQNLKEIKNLKMDNAEIKTSLKEIKKDIKNLEMDNAEIKASLKKIDILSVYCDPIGKFKTNITEKVKQRNSEITAWSVLKHFLYSEEEKEAAD